MFVIIIEVPRLRLKAAFISQKELGPRITTNLTFYYNSYIYVLTGLIHLSAQTSVPNTANSPQHVSLPNVSILYGLFPSLMHGLFLTMPQFQPYLRTLIIAKLIDLSQFLLKLYMGGEGCHLRVVPPGQLLRRPSTPKPFIKPGFSIFLT